MILREATRADVKAIHGLIVELAVYEKEPDAVINTPEQLEYDLFDDPICGCFVAELDGQVVGFALHYTSYSTWKGRSMYLEDFYVQPKHRGKGIGKALFEEVVKLARERKVARMDWQVLEWNQLAIDFYKSAGADLDAEWINGRFHF